MDSTSTPSFDWSPFIHGAEFIFLLVLGLWLFNLWWGPHYRVWSARKEGEADLALAHQKGLADLARAQSEQQIQVAEAQNRLAAAEANKKAAIVEAEAVAEQIKIIGDNVKEHPLYLTWQWIKMMHERDGDTIYVPTEANLPVIEAGRMMIGSPKE